MPCPSHLTPFTFFASKLKTSTKVFPIILRFSSGSEIPSRAFKNLFEASTPLTFKPIPEYCAKTSSYSFFLSNPLLTKIQFSLSPKALLSSIAATDESTPPERPRITTSSHTISLISLIAMSIKESGVQSCFTLAISTKKFFNICLPSVV